MCCQSCLPGAPQVWFVTIWVATQPLEVAAAALPCEPCLRTDAFRSVFSPRRPQRRADLSPAGPSVQFLGTSFLDPDLALGQRATRSAEAIWPLCGAARRPSAIWLDAGGAHTRICRTPPERRLGLTAALVKVSSGQVAELAPGGWALLRTDPAARAWSSTRLGHITNGAAASNCLLSMTAPLLSRAVRAGQTGGDNWAPCGPVHPCLRRGPARLAGGGSLACTDGEPGSSRADGLSPSCSHAAQGPGEARSGRNAAEANGLERIGVRAASARKVAEILTVLDAEASSLSGWRDLRGLDRRPAV